MTAQESLSRGKIEDAKLPRQTTLGRDEPGANVNRRKSALVSASLLALLLTSSVLCNRWLIANHLVELLRPAALVTLAASGLLLLALLFATRLRGPSLRLLSVASWVLPAAATLALLSSMATFRVLGPAIIWWSGFSPAQISPNGRLLAMLGGWPPYYTRQWTQAQLLLLDVESGSRLTIGMAPTGSHVPRLYSLAFDDTGCRAFWLRLEPRWEQYLAVLRQRRPYPSKFAESSWPARLYWLDACRGKVQPIATSQVLPNLEPDLSVVGKGRYLTAHTADRLWVFDTMSWNLTATYELPRDRLSAWVTYQNLFGEDSHIRMVRKQYAPSALETLDIDLGGGSPRRVSFVDFESDPKPGFDSAEAHLLAVEATASTAIVRRDHSRWVEPRGIERECDFELYDLNNGDRLFALEGAGCGVSTSSAVYLKSGHLALASDLYTLGRGKLWIVDRSGNLLLSESWEGSDRFRVLWEGSGGTIAVTYSDAESESHVELFRPKTGERQLVATGYYALQPTEKGILVGNEDQLLEIDDALQQHRVILDGV